MPEVPGSGERRDRMKRLFCALLAVCLLALSACSLAESRLSEALMIYEDYDGQRAEQTVDDEETLQELEDMLLRAAGQPAELEGCTMNCTLFCMLPNGVIYDFAIATDGCPYITDMNTDKTYRLNDEDCIRLWEIFDLVQAVKGYDANELLNW